MADVLKPGLAAEPPPDPVVMQRHISELSGQVSSLASLVRDLQKEVKKSNYRRDYIARIFALIIVLSVMAGAIIIQQVDYYHLRNAGMTTCSASNDQLRAQRALYQTLIYAEQQELNDPQLTANAAIRQIRTQRIQTYTLALNALRIQDCIQIYG